MKIKHVKMKLKIFTNQKKSQNLAANSVAVMSPWTFMPSRNVVLFAWKSLLCSLKGYFPVRKNVAKSSS